MSHADESSPYVSRGGLKLAAALAAFGVAPRGWVCADLGSHVGGFVDCLLQHGAARVYAVEPGYGVLDFRLRRETRVISCERQNALRWTAPEPCALITADCGWTPLRLLLPAIGRSLALPAAARQAGHGHDPLAIVLIKPQYEEDKAHLVGGRVMPERLDAVLAQCRRDAQEQNWRIEAEIESPILGHGGNREFLWQLRR